MRYHAFAAFFASYTVSMVSAAPTSRSNEFAVVNPLADFPFIAGPPEGVPGFKNVDPDGVYRTYLANGTVVAAARLDLAQIDAYLDGIAPNVTTADLADIRTAFSNANSAAVSDTQLLNPPKDVMPLEKLAKAAARLGLVSRSVSPLEPRQFLCTMENYYCVYDANACILGNCLCNGVICTGYYSVGPP